MTRSLLVTGGSGFIGSAFLRRNHDRFDRVMNVDAHTYAADERRLPSGSDRLESIRLDITDPSLETLFSSFRPTAVVHFAAETHVTRSESDEELFLRTNIEGTRSVLRAAQKAEVGFVIHVSTDEVYGSALDHPFREDEKLPGEGHATSAYARSKAIADDVACEFGEVMPVMVVRPTNCFGPWQHPEKAIARWTVRALSGDRLPVWGDGLYVRDWMFVDDLSSAIEMLVEDSPRSGVCNIGPGRDALPNVEMARSIAAAAAVSPDLVYLTEYDRPDHDRMYSVDTRLIRSLGWTPRIGIHEGIGRTVEWYRNNREWWRPLIEEAENLYADERDRSRS